MSDMPDFDSMTPEQLTEWMESLAVRQGATEGLTTAASMDIADVDEDDERLAGMGEYKPFGMSDEDWAKMQAREAEEKAAKLAAQPAPTPEPVAPPAPEPEAIPEPVAEEPSAAGSDDMPDFDSMTPEQLTEWMESLAVRQGATEGLTTAASMDIGEVDEADERLAGMGEYKPFGMSDEDWAKMQAREAEEKAAKLSAQSSAPVEAIIDEDDDDDDYSYEDDDDYQEYDDDEEYFEYQDDSEELVMADLTELGFDEADETSDSEELVLADLSSLGLGEDDEEEDSEELVVADFGLSDEEYEDSEIVSAVDFNSLIPEDTLLEEEADASANPMDWLASLSGTDETDAPELDLTFEALGEITGLGMDEPVGDPMDWLASLSGSDSDDGLPDFAALSADAGDDDSEGSLEWMESLAVSEGAPDDELVTSADLDIPVPTSLNEDGPGYEEFSFEDATGIVQDTDSIAPILNLDDEEESELVLNDPESWLDNLAAGVSDNEIPDDIFDNIDFDEEPRADEEQFDDLADNVKSQMDAGKLGDSPDDINKFFQSAFARAATRDDVPDYIDMEDDSEAEEDYELGELPVQAEIPDWLQESMATMPSELDEAIEEEMPTSQKTATAEMMVADLGLDENVDDIEIPDWLQGGADEDTGMIDLDIFDKVDEDGEFDEEVFELNTLAMDDTQDTWVEAFSTEDTGEIAAWYDDAVAGYGDSQPKGVQSQTAAISLEAADLPIETKLEEGSPQNVPIWLGGATGTPNVEVAAVQDDSMDWLSEDLGDSADLDMPDWLKDTVDDSITDAEDLPDWLAGEADIEPDDIPDWLRETMEDEDEEPVVQQTFVAEALVETPAPSAPLPVPVAQSPAPVPVSADKIDAVAYLRSAKEKLSAKNIDGAMLDYEQVIRANKALSQVEKELQRLVEEKAYKRNPSVNRVLGDVLMRQGKLQDALDIYRKALNML